MASRLLSGWGRTSPGAAEVEIPFSLRDLEDRFAAPSPRGILARGLGRSYGDAAQNSGGRVLDMTELGHVLEADTTSGVVTASAGACIDRLVRLLLPRGWFPTVTPGTRFVTVGGAIASDVHGKNHHRDGGFCDHVSSFGLLSPGGGSPVVVAGGSETFDATAGGMGLTGVVTSVTFQMLPVRTSRIRQDTDRATDLDELMSLMSAGDGGYRYSVAWLDTLARGGRLGRGVLTRGDHASIEELPPLERDRPLEAPPAPAFSVPGIVPSGLLGPLAARAFNEVWFQKAPKQERGRIVPLQTFFYPLDVVRDWNRVYGHRGFIQYQFVVPFEASEVVRKVLEMTSTRGCPVFLAVLKRFGRGRGLLSFPIPGWTLALDMPAGAAGLSDLLDRFDQRVVEAGGRVYLSKDARLRPEVLAGMYPELERWREIRDRLDPEHRMTSDLDRRLGLARGLRRAERTRT